MARFTVVKLDAPLPVPGVYAATIVSARETIAESGNPVLRLRARFHDSDSSELSFYVTFAPSEKSVKLVGYFAQSCDIVLPPAGSAVDLRASDVQGRLFYTEITLDPENQPRITKFLRRAEAVAINPVISQTPAQAPVTLKAVNGGSL